MNQVTLCPSSSVSFGYILMTARTFCFYICRRNGGLNCARLVLPLKLRSKLMVVSLLLLAFLLASSMRGSNLHLEPFLLLKCWILICHA